MQSVISFRRIDRNGKEIVAVCNFVPVARDGYRIGVPYEGVYEQAFSSDDVKYGGTGLVQNGKLKSEDYAMHGYEQSIVMDIPAMSVMYFTVTPKKKRTEKAKTDANASADKTKSTVKEAKTQTAAKASKPAAKKPAGKAGKSGKTAPKSKK